VLPVLIQQTSGATARLARSASHGAPIVRHRRSERTAKVEG
jgi:hypothetical protein